jgi:hypothetical protein
VQQRTVTVIVRAVCKPTLVLLTACCLFGSVSAIVAAQSLSLVVSHASMSLTIKTCVNESNACSVI